jgi:hypothetical protein
LTSKEGASALHLKVFEDRSVLVQKDGSEEVFLEGTPSAEARQRYRAILEQFRRGFFQSAIDAVAAGRLEDIPDDQRDLVDGLVEGITSEVGRALVGLTVLMLCVKCIDPSQSVRLHKAGLATSTFSWREGIPMRSLDASFVTPVLRSNQLLSVNSFGVMMTRSLAENYPYSRVYKAALRGPRQQWLEIVEALEASSLDPRLALQHLLTRLMQRSEAFRECAARALLATAQLIATGPSYSEIAGLILEHIQRSRHSPRLLEVAMHSAMQCLEDELALPGRLRPLAQMRSANKKAGNIGDIEVIEANASEQIMEAWDAKFGQPYLLDQLEELAEKLQAHPNVEVAGFVVDSTPSLPSDVTERRDEISEEFGADIIIISFPEWVQLQVARSDEDRDSFASKWLLAYAESLCLRRPEKAPIDEPADQWVEDLTSLISRQMRGSGSPPR